MSRPLVCIGGPWHGQVRTIPRDARSVLVLTSTAPAFIFDASVHDPGFNTPPSAATVETAVYKVERIEIEANGLSMKGDVLAYYGRDAQDRPKGFYL